MGRRIVRRLRSEQTLERGIAFVELWRRTMVDQHHPSFLVDRLLDSPAQRIQTSGVHDDLLGKTKNLAIVAEIHERLKRLFLPKFGKVEHVFIVRQEP